MKRFGSLLVLGCLALVACSGGDDGVKCSLKNPIAVDESPDQWPKFRRDSQNTGTIALGAEAYEVIADETRLQREPVWVFPRLEDEPRGPFPASAAFNGATGDDRRVYIGSTDGTMFSIQANNGVPFDTLLGGGILFAVPPAAITSSALVGTLNGLDAIVVGTGDARLVGIDGDGIILARVWPFPTDSFVRASPAMTVNGLFMAGSLGTGIYGVCPNGVAQFGVNAGSTESSAGVGRDPDNKLDGTFYVGGSDRRLRAIQRDGILRWTFSMSAPVVASPVVQLSSDGTETDAIYVADVNGLISKVGNDGLPVDDFGFIRGSIGPIESSPTLTQHPTATLRLYVGSDDGNLYAVDAVSGAILWSFPTGGLVRSSPAAILNAEAPADPIVVVGSFDGTLYFVRDTGNEPVLIGTFTVPGEDSPENPTSIESSPAVDIDGTVIIGSDNGRVYAIR